MTTAVYAWIVIRSSTIDLMRTDIMDKNKYRRMSRRFFKERSRCVRWLVISVRSAIDITNSE